MKLEDYNVDCHSSECSMEWRHWDVRRVWCNFM